MIESTCGRDVRPLESSFLGRECKRRRLVWGGPKRLLCGAGQKPLRFLVARGEDTLQGIEGRIGLHVVVGLAATGLGDRV
jgi:hypothetical protein